MFLLLYSLSGCSVGYLRHTYYICRKQNAMVEENILKLHVRKVQKNINKKANFVLSLEKRALQLGTGEMWEKLSVGM